MSPKKKGSDDGLEYTDLKDCPNLKRQVYSSVYSADSNNNWYLFPYLNNFEEQGNDLLYVDGPP